MNSGINWSAGPGEPLVKLVKQLRENQAGTVYLIKTTCKRPDCRCALRNYDSLMLFPVLDTFMTLADWNYWHPVSKHQNFNFSKNLETQSKLILFKQCRGWFEVLNESHIATPYLTTLEQVRRTKSTMFLVRKDLRCQIAPDSLLIPEVYETVKHKELTFPSLSVEFLATASSPEILINAKIDFVRAGSILRLVTYLPNCIVKRGKKTKELGFLLFLECMSKESKSNIESANSKNSFRLIYLSVEDSTPSVYYPKLALSSLAGPENISGVHIISNLLRKFRLPLSIKPCPLVDQLANQQSKFGGDISNHNHNSKQGKVNLPRSNESSNISLYFSNPKLSNSFTAITPLVFTDNHYLRLHALYRGNILMIAPIVSPERLFLITPSMLEDHLFKMGTTKDQTYLNQMTNHRAQALHFLTIAHPMELLNYLIRHMEDVTCKPRDSCSSLLLKSNTSDNHELNEEELHQLYNEIDDIYFFIRTGYYPSKTRKSSQFGDNLHMSRSEMHLTSNQKFSKKSDELELKKIATTGVDAKNRLGFSKADELLAASLHPSTLNSNPSNFINTSSSRLQPKEYGI